MRITVSNIIELATALAPVIGPAAVSVNAILGALQGAGALDDAEIDDKLRALIGEALAAKAEAEAEAARPLPAETGQEAPGTPPAAPASGTSLGG